MAFEGNIRDFGVADVLQLINSQGKTGVLAFHSRKESIAIGFENGMISSASHNKKGVLKPIGDYLVLTGKISTKELKKCNTIAKKKGVSLVDTLVENSVLSKEDLEKMIEFKIQEVVDELFTWKQGEYKFQLGEKLYTKSQYSVFVNPQFLILEGMRRIDEWPKIKESISDSKIVFSKKKRPSLSIEMGEQEKTALALINGENCVEDIVSSSGLGKFRTYHAIYNLLEGGVIERSALAARPKYKRTVVRKLSASVIRNIVLWGVVSLILAGNIILGIVFRPFYKKNVRLYKSESKHIENYRKYKMQELKKVYKLIKGKEPDDIDLIKDGWIRE